MARGAKKKPVRKSKARKKPPQTKKRDFKAEYARRIKNAVAKGKTRQAARGHKPKEHVARKEREIAEQGITSSQLKSVRKFLERFNAPVYKGVPDEDQIVEFIQSEKYEAFMHWRKEWDSYRNAYLKALKNGTLINGTLGYTVDFVVAQMRVPDEKWMYYH